MQNNESRILDYLKANETEIFADLEELVKADSPSATAATKHIIANCTDVLKAIFKRRLNLEPIKTHPQEIAGDHLQYEWGSSEEKVIVVCHYDTVWEPGSIEIKREGNRFHGPGILDMKAGIVSAVWSIKAYIDLDIDPGKKIIVFCSSDEELAAKTYRPIIAELSKDCKAAIIVEPAEEITGKLKTARKGSRRYIATIRGKASHAGNNHKGGINAIEEMARQIQYIHSLTDYDKGTTLNVGICSGGIKANVVPDFARFEIDTRFTTVSEAERIYNKLMAIKPSLSGTSVDIVPVSAGILPLERTEANVKLYEKVKKAAESLGIEIDQCYAGGGSDGNFLSAMGIPTIDGMGAVGDGIHARHEHIYIDQYIPKIALLAASIVLF